MERDFNKEFDEMMKRHDEEFNKLMKDKIEYDKNKQNKVWKPNIGDTYYFITEDGGISSNYWDDDGYDNDRFEFGNVFKTEEETEIERNKTLIKRKVERWIKENDTVELDWYYNIQEKWNIHYDYEYGDLEISRYYTIKNNEFNLSSEELAEQCIAKFKNDLIWYFKNI